MLNDDELNRLTLRTAVRMIQEKQISASELRRTVVARIERLNPDVNALITVMPDDAAGDDIAPLFGAPLSVKDLFDTKGVRTTAGAKLFANRLPEEDAAAVTSLRRAGAAIIGKTNLHEFAYGVTTINPHFGTAKNPRDRTRISGGSSGGSAVAVALSMGLGSLGTDTGGSIRIPASLCGIVGLKPTYGLVSLKGVIPLSPYFDHAGPMAKTVEDTAFLLELLTGLGYARSLTGDIRGLRVGIPDTHFYEELDPAVEKAVRDALGLLERLGAQTVDVHLPEVAGHQDLWAQVAAPEAYAYHEAYLKDHRDMYGEDVRTRLETARGMFSINYVKSQNVCRAIRTGCAKLFDTCDIIVAPTIPIPAPRIEEAQTAVATLGRFTRYFNMARLPAISVPCGFTADGLPIGMQIAGAARDDATVLRAAHAYEQNARWFDA